MSLYDVSGAGMTDSRSLRIIFMGTPDFAVAPLRALHEAGHAIACVYTQPPRPRGRGHQVQKSPVQLYAEEHGLQVLHPQSLKNSEEQKKFAAFESDLAVVAAYGLILPRPVLEAPKYGCINIHASLLPRWRGASPIQRAIWEGDKETGVTLMQMDEGLDTGNIIAMKSISLTEKTTAAALHDDLAALGAAMITETAAAMARQGKPQSTKQDNAKATYAALLTKQDGRVQWSQTATQIGRQIRALNPWPGVWCEYSGKRIKILEALPIDMKAVANPGEILDRNGYVACAENTALQIFKLQPENAKVMDFVAAVNGGYVRTGEKFS